MLLLVLLFLLGPVTLWFSSREMRLQRRPQREGVRVQGIVVRYKRMRADENVSLSPMVAFSDADGHPREIRSVSSGTGRWPIGLQEPVVHLPGAPSTAPIDLSSERRGIATVLIVVSGFFTIAPIVIMVLGLGHHWNG